MVNYVNVYTYKKDVSFRNGLWVNVDGEPVTGIKKAYSNGSYGTLQDETMLVDGVNNGLQKVYDPKGNLWYENSWKNGVLVSFKKIS